MSMVDYLEEVKKLIATQFDLEVDSIEEDSSLAKDLNIADLDLEDLIERIEEKYQIKIPSNQYSRFKSVGDIANYLYENIDKI